MDSDIVLASNYSNILLFTYDAKIFKLINSQEDTEFLQKDLNDFYDWCNFKVTTFNIKNATILYLIIIYLMIN